MSHFGLKISKTESPDKTPYTVYYPHRTPTTGRNWNQGYYQVVSIDPARKNYALRIERRYTDGWIRPIVFDKVSIECIVKQDDVTICNTYQVLTDFLDKYQTYYQDCHFVVIERQLPQNYKATRIAQHTISYFSLILRDKPLLPAIVEVDPKLKGKILGAPKNITDKQLKTWAVEKARELLTMRLDEYSLGVLNHFRTKQDDLSDTVCQIEAIFICWGLPPTGPPPVAELAISRPASSEIKLSIPRPASSEIKLSIPRPASSEIRLTLTPDDPVLQKLMEPESNTTKLSLQQQQSSILSLVTTAPSRPTGLTHLKVESSEIQHPKVTLQILPSSSK
jgi:hypothetical protein